MEISSALKRKDLIMLKHTWFLYLTEFISGISVMAVELGASRLLSPYFSSSQIVWTLVIGTIMIAMALGNIYGGRSADKDPNPDKLYRRLLIAGVWIALIPVLGKYIIAGISGLVIITVNESYLVRCALASCLVLFIFPLFLLGTVTPSLVKYTVQSLDDSGKTVGYLGAFNTIGSIIGTFLPTFVTIPTVGTSVTFLLFAGLLLSLALLYFAALGKGYGKLAAVLVLFATSCLFGHKSSFAFWNSRLAYEGESLYNYLQVQDTPEEAILSTNVLFGVQSLWRKDGKLTGMYYDYAMAAPLMADKPAGEPLKLLVLGNGSGTYASQCSRYFAPAQIEGVEIDQKITDLAHTYFAMPEDVKVTTYDGRAYLHGTKEKYHVILVDAYQDISVPFQMSSVEFFREVKDHLAPGGVMVINMNMRGQGEGSINAYLADTIGSVFKEVYTVDVENGTNRELFASDTPGMVQRLSKNTETLARANNPGNVTPEQKKEFVTFQRMNAFHLQPYHKGNHILTDDRAPVEVLSMQALDGIIQSEVAGYKKVIKEKGIRGLLE